MQSAPLLCFASLVGLESTMVAVNTEAPRVAKSDAPGLDRGAMKRVNAIMTSAQPADAAIECPPSGASSADGDVYSESLAPVARSALFAEVREVQS